MSRIHTCFEQLQQSNQKALISYITAGDPHPSHTLELMHALTDAGSDIIELGIPFSDPMADGPVIQLACERALKHETSLHDVINIVKQFRETNSTTPIVLMGYQNPIEIFGVEKFAQTVTGLVDGVITVDLPPEESQQMASIYKAQNIDTIYLLAPTTKDKRVQMITDLASGFLYYVSFKGITGASQIDVASVEEKVTQIRKHTDIPVAVGFGIKDAKTARMVADCSNAVVVGSAIVSIIAEYGDDLPTAVGKVKTLLHDIKNALDNSQSVQNIA
ncbi:MAG: tryptophan synthase subunit alpha [Gammaproteobacteria bacterium]|nr:tryptophan synthase subunit alpha [Gammaproteobacteria bacterium]